MSSVENAKKRVEEIDVLRGFAICMVILGHAIIEFPVNITQVPWCSWLRYSIYAFHMPLFFVVSGYVYKCSQYRSYLRGKIQRIAVPYFVFGGLSLLLHVFAVNLVNGSQTMEDALVQLLLYGGDYWFLYTLFLMLALFPLVERALKNDWLLVLLCAAAIGVQCFATLPNLLGIASAAYYFPWFAAGYLCRKHLNAFWPTVRKHTGKTLAVSFLLSVSIIIFCKQREPVPVLLRYLKALFPMIFLTVSANLLAENAHRKSLGAVKDFLTKCSAYSLQFYLFNGYFLTVLREILCRVLHITAPSVLVLTITFFTITGTLILCEVVRYFSVVSYLCGLTPKKGR